MKSKVLNDIGERTIALILDSAKEAMENLTRFVRGQYINAARFTAIGADQRKALEHLCRYITRPAITNERLKRNRAGQVALQLKSAYQDGTTHIVMSPLLSSVREEFMQRLAALVPRPRLHLIRFHGVLAPHAKLRAAIVPTPADNSAEHAADDIHAHPSPARMSWACLLKRVFDHRINCTSP